jgi:hypothetical protein
MILPFLFGMNELNKLAKVEVSLELLTLCTVTLSDGKKIPGQVLLFHVDAFLGELFDLLSS